MHALWRADIKAVDGVTRLGRILRLGTVRGGVATSPELLATAAHVPSWSKRCKSGVGKEIEQSVIVPLAQWLSQVPSISLLCRRLARIDRVVLEQCLARRARGIDRGSRRRPAP